MYVTCWVRYLPLLNEFIRENIFYAYKLISFSIFNFFQMYNTSFSTSNSYTIWPKLQKDF